MAHTTTQTWQQAEADGKPLTIEQRANKIAYQSGLPAAFILLVLKLEERVTTLEAASKQSGV